MKKPNNWVIRCRKCGEFISSDHRHDFKYCGCKSTHVDGGNSYLKLGFDPEAGRPDIYRLVRDEEELE